MILTKYYANEKPVVKNRLQLLFFYSEKANNTVEISEGCKAHPVLKNMGLVKNSRISVTPVSPEEFDLVIKLTHPDFEA
jgi:predicted RNA-binding protein with PUA-like domain